MLGRRIDRNEDTATRRLAERHFSLALGEDGVVLANANVFAGEFEWFVRAAPRRHSTAHFSVYDIARTAAPRFVRG